MNEYKSMATNDEVVDIGRILATLLNEEELIIKPFQPGKNSIINLKTLIFIIFKGSANEIGAIECGKIVSRLNKILFDYQIGIKFY